MSAFNWFNTRKRAFEQRTIAITTSATVTTYTAKVGSTANNLITDRVINVTTAAGCDITITLPDGVYEGQRLLVNFITDGGTSTVTVVATTGAGGDSTMVDAGMYMTLEWVNSTTGWIVLAESVTT